MSEKHTKGATNCRSIYSVSININNRESAELTACVNYFITKITLTL